MYCACQFIALVGQICDDNKCVLREDINNTAYSLVSMFDDFVAENSPMIDSYLSEWFSKVPAPYPVAKDMLERLKGYVLNGGKRIRPLLILLSNSYLGKKDEEVLAVASCYELCHAFLLIHDDIMDESYLRRGKPTMHIAYGKEMNSAKMGVSMGMLSGDTLLFLAYDMLFKSSLSLEAKHRVLAYLNEVMLTTCYGQALDFMIHTTATEEDILEVYRTKTSQYSIFAPLKLGLLICDEVPSSTEAQLLSIAEPLGIAFQIQDDLLDLFSDPAVTGKAIGQDIREGKYTLLMHYGCMHSDEKEYLLKSLGNNRLTDTELSKIVEILRACGAEEYCRSKVQDLFKEAQQAIDRSTMSAKDILHAFAEYLMKRIK
ncbi:polyprenyl synthetase family protein [Candidatus Woesearchaeota archaeon]|nr:polyprenyl synthetase family protein [Candidatus Woesearchaeota archaeon]